MGQEHENAKADLETAMALRYQQAQEGISGPGVENRFIPPQAQDSLGACLERFGSRNVARRLENSLGEDEDWDEVMEHDHYFSLRLPCRQQCGS